MSIEANHFEKYIYNQTNGSGTTIEDTHDVLGQDPTIKIILLGILAIFIIVINGLITVSFMLNKSLRKRPANIMICSQACTDLFTGTVFVPIELIDTPLAHTLSLFLSCYMLYLSLFNLLVISIDRYLALSRPFIHRKLIDVSRTKRLIIIVWFAPLGVILIPLFWWFSSIGTRIKAEKIYICTIWIIMLILVVTMTILYVFATRRAKKTIRNRRASCGNRAKAKAAMLARKELRVVHLFGLLLFFFVAAYLPILYINFVSIIGFEIYAPTTLISIGLYLLILNSIVNPILCIMLKKDYLQAIKKLFLFKQKSEDLWSLSSQYGSQYSSCGSKRSTGYGSHRKKSQSDYNYSAKAASCDRKQGSSPDGKKSISESSPDGKLYLNNNLPEEQKLLNMNSTEDKRTSTSGSSNGRKSTLRKNSPEKRFCFKRSPGNEGKPSSPEGETSITSSPSSPEGKTSIQSDTSVYRKFLHSSSPEKRFLLQTNTNDETDFRSSGRKQAFRRKSPERKLTFTDNSFDDGNTSVPCRSPRDRRSFILSSSPEGRISLESNFTFDKKCSFMNSPSDKVSLESNFTSHKKCSFINSPSEKKCSSITLPSDKTQIQNSPPVRKTLLQRLSSTDPPTFLHGTSPAERKRNINNNNSPERKRRTGVHTPVERRLLQRDLSVDNGKGEMMQLIENVV